MKEITSIEDLPKCRLSVMTTFAPSHYPKDVEMKLVRDKMRHQLVNEIQKNEDLFNIEFYKGFMSVRADIIVLTPEQYHQIARSKFEQGVLYGREMRPMPYTLEKEQP